MTGSRKLAALAPFALIVASACSADPDAALREPAGEQAPLQQSADSRGVMRLVEANQLQQRLEPIQQRAMQDEELARQLDDLRARLDETLHVEGAELLARMERLRADFNAAQQAQDAERAEEIGRQAEGVQAEIEALQQAILGRPEIRAAIAAFQEAQRARMIEIDAEAGPMLDRLKEITAEAEGP